MSGKLTQQFSTFAEFTSFHGFRELAESQRWYQKVIWIIIMLGSIGMLGYAVQNQVGQYISGRTTTKVTLLSDDEPDKYPDIWMSISNWMWLDMEKVDRYGITYEQLQYAKGFLTPNETLEFTINLTEIELALLDSMKRMNVSGISQFFSALSMDDFGGGESNWRFLARHVEPLGFAYYAPDLSGVASTPFTLTKQLILMFDFSKFYENAKRIARFFKTQWLVGSTRTISREKSDPLLIYGYTVGVS